MAKQEQYGLAPWMILAPFKTDDPKEWDVYVFSLHKYVGPFYSYSQALSFYRSVNK